MQQNKYYQRTKYVSLEQQAKPQDPETECTVLATMMRYNDIYDANADLLNAALFYDDRRRAIYRTISGVINEGKITDINTLYDYSQTHKVSDSDKADIKLERIEFVNIFQKSSPSTFKQDVLRLRDYSKRRLMWDQLQIASSKVLNLMENPDVAIDELSTVLSALQDETEDKGVSTFGDAISELEAIVEDNRKGVHRYLKTGFFIFDNFYLLRPDTLTVIAAFTSVGKSALAMNIASAVAKQGIGVGYYSLEMGKSDLASRELSGIAGVSSSDIMNRKLEGDTYTRFKQAASRERNLPIYIDERATLSFDRTMRSIRTLKKTVNIGLAIIDYLQVYNQTGDSTESVLAEMARSSKNLSKELQMPIIVLSQLNRNGDHPTRKMLRGSGQIEESADNIVLIDRPESEPNNKIGYEGSLKGESTHNTAAFILAKGRGVGTCVRLMGFEPRYTQFYELDKNGKPIPKVTPGPEQSDLPF